MSEQEIVQIISNLCGNFAAPILAVLLFAKYLIKYIAKKIEELEPFNKIKDMLNDITEIKQSVVELKDAYNKISNVEKKEEV